MLVSFFFLLLLLLVLFRLHFFALKNFFFYVTGTLSEQVFRFSFTLFFIIICLLVVYGVYIPFIIENWHSDHNSIWMDSSNIYYIFFLLSSCLFFKVLIFFIIYVAKIAHTSVAIHTSSFTHTHTHTYEIKWEITTQNSFLFAF